MNNVNRWNMMKQPSAPTTAPSRSRGLMVGIASAIAIAVLFAATPTMAAEHFITVASTTSTRDSGLFKYILPIFTGKTGIEVRVVAVGTGQAIRIARNGDADVLLVHHKPSEKKFVAEGFGIRRHDLMYNDFVLVGPDADPAGISGGNDINVAFKKIAGKKAIFLSRGDDSGTNKKEAGLWKMTGVDPKKSSGSWYRETGSGMGRTLNMATAMGGYTLSDRGTWLAFNNRKNMKIVVQGDPRIHNPYGVILVNAKRHPTVKSVLGQTFIDWLISSQGQNAIGAFRVKGKQLFYPRANSKRNRAGLGR